MRSIRFFALLFVFTSLLVLSAREASAYYNVTAAPATVNGVTTAATPVGSGTVPAGGISSGNAMVCSSSANAAPMQAYCVDPTTTCTMIPTTIGDGDPIGLCFPAGAEYCLQNSDCTALGRPTCLDSSTSGMPFTGYKPGENKYVGICGSLAPTTDNNVLSDALCSGIKLVTGKAGRAFVAICVIVMGVLFFTGKISWNIVLAAALGCGGIFGAPSVVGVVTGKPLTCK